MSKCDEIISKIGSLSDVDLVREFLLSEFTMNVIFMYHFHHFIPVDDL